MFVIADAQELWIAGIDWATNSLGGVIADSDTNGVARRVGDRFDLTIFVELVQLAVGASGLQPKSGRDATGGHLSEVSAVAWIADPHHCPLFACGYGISTPQNLG